VTALSLDAPARAGGPPALQAAAPARPGGASREGRAAFAKAPLQGYRSRVHPTPEIDPRKGEGILKRIALFLDKDGGEAVLDLDPPTLGRLAVRMVVEGDKVELRLHAGTDAVARFLEKNLAPLRQVLAEQGLTLTAFDVTSGGPEESPARFARDAEGRARAARAVQGPGGAAPEEAPPPPPAPIRTLGKGSALDLFA